MKKSGPLPDPTYNWLSDPSVFNIAQEPPFAFRHEGFATENILGTLAGIALFVLEQFDLWQLHYTINVGLMTLLSTVIFVAVNLLTTASDAEKVTLLTYRRELLMDGFQNVPWYKNYIYQIVVLVINIICILIWLW